MKGLSKEFTGFTNGLKVIARGIQGTTKGIKRIIKEIERIRTGFEGIAKGSKWGQTWNQSDREGN